MTLPLYVLDIDDTKDGEGEVFAVGLVTQPAIERNWMAFAATKQHFDVFDEEHRILAGPLMVADQPIYRRDDDGKEYNVSFPAKSIYKIVNKLARSGKILSFNYDHEDKKAAKSCYLQQSFIINSSLGINTPEGFAKLPDGSWFGFVKVEDENEWEEAKKRKGFSVEGFFTETKILDADKQVLENLKNQLLNMSIIKKENLEKILGKDLYAKFAKAFEAEIPAPVGDPVVLESEALADGSGSLKGKIATGETVMLVASDGTESPAPDGQHILANGKTITVMAGVITEVMEAPVADFMTEEKVLAAIQTSLDTQETKLTEAFEAKLKAVNDSHSKEMTSTKEKFSALVEAFELLAETKAPAPAPKDDPRKLHEQSRVAKFDKIADTLQKINKQNT